MCLFKKKIGFFFGFCIASPCPLLYFRVEFRTIKAVLLALMLSGCTHYLALLFLLLLQLFLVCVPPYFYLLRLCIEKQTQLLKLFPTLHNGSKSLRYLWLTYIKCFKLLLDSFNVGYRFLLTLS